EQTGQSVFSEKGDTMISKRKTLVSKLASLLLFGGLLSINTLLYAQVDTIVEIEIDRDSNELSDLLIGAPLPKPEFAPLLDTAMIVTSVHGAEVWVNCSARDAKGELRGRIRVRLPAFGVRFFLASDIVEERGFVGSVLCSTPAYVIGTEIMLGVVTTDVDVKQDNQVSSSNLLFPVTAMN
ncbi:MAG: hypothetical protein RL120_05990, partial [Gammaproteobacteria bacterium]